ncbi:MAG: hypothetical protein HKP61_09060 [Dactylosporangium sp.]|nr:hypothetical protein [Dactylosporangium sp.]NNJ61080.1 hypothetical protein [Dactylosporangium sp.]
MRRLRTMLATSTNNIEIYRLLAEIHRTVGDTAEAGRWGYLTDEVTVDEIRAFERTHPQPSIRLQLLGWSGGAETLPSDAARARLRSLQHQAVETTIPLQRRAEPAIRRRPHIPAQRRPETPDRREQPPPGQQAPPLRLPPSGVTRPRPVRKTIRNYAILALLILGGSAGSLITVGGIRALFGVKNWFAPVSTLLKAIARAVSG